MKKFRSIILYGLSLALAVCCAVAGTVAYLTSEDSDVNVMALGNVKIDQFEKERVFDDLGNVVGMKDFSQAQPLYPAVGINGVNSNEVWAPNQNVDIYYKDYLGDRYPGGNGTWQNLNNVLDKFVFVENTGKTDAYYRTIILLEADQTNFKNEYGQGLIHVNVNGHSLFSWSPKHGDVDNNAMIVEVDGTKYNVLVATYQNILTPGEISRPSLLQVGMDQMATNEHCEQFGNTYDIKVLSQAVQAKGFSDAETALDEGFGEVNAANVVKWFTRGEVSDSNIEFKENNDEDAIKVEGTDKAAILDAIEDAKAGDVIVLGDDTTIAGYDATKKLIIDKPITIDLNGKTINTECGWGGIDLKGGASIVNGTINHTGNTAAIKAYQVGKIENVVINVTETAGKIKGGIVVQEGADTYIGSIKNVVINGVTNGIETYRCGKRDNFAIGSMENVTINAIENGMLLSAPVGTITNCTIKGGKIGINAQLKGDYSVSATLKNCIVSGETDIYAYDEHGKTNPGTLNIVYDAATSLNCSAVTNFEAEVADRVFVGIK